ncbi:bifunctional ATP-dependent DNA helicase/DNA polymerase III subunit epsilon [Clostridium tepidiprofundi DSM 19306]|uniref:Bifunctional ATP-dependent DNA helicase/DNA polymerase III subunit epsilon n=1 Tax=Clostridium tepidiprofundi DSM 19306 TaxID=1121338 RepID=A0A151B4I0_9CLOT|nr:ATP-dependent DNA helicase [Clostridium tepidiprofundi]KYH34700.1 bifunctional ATP-dependent DNA helicase/DNA polymerase III subunit epsilon [Clostridium tepidiprofundi DSM 19306]
MSIQNIRDTKNTISISVRNLVEFVLRSGDLDMRFMGTSRAIEGTRAHQKVQKSMGDEYNAEVYLSHVFEKDDITIELAGRADGIIEYDGVVIVDEIKTTTKTLEYIEEDYNIVHWAQAKCYAYMYALQNELKEIYVQLTYYQLDTKNIKRFKRIFTIEELEKFFDDIINRYFIWAKWTYNWRNIRDKSIEELGFPFKNYRKGQREFAVAVYSTIREGGKLFAQAPTGIGKTIGTVFPSIKAVGEGLSSKIFYLTAKTITRTVAENAFNKLRQNGLRFKTITLSAKDKICPNPGVGCNPESCEYARGHFDRVNDAIFDILNKDEFTRETIEEYAQKYRICPFEFSLDVALWSDGIICDYNYAFDPRVYLRRFFQDNSGDYIFLIDEAHNLVDRSREMFSAEIYKKPILELKKKTKELAPKVSKYLNKLNSFMVKGRKLCEKENFYLQKDAPQDIYTSIRKFISEAEEWLVDNPEADFREDLLQFYFDALSFIRTSETYDDRYVTYYEKINDDVKLKLFCLDPSYLLKEAMKRGKASILFSATLTPLPYFIKILGGDENSYRMRLKSPFPQENLHLFINDRISTKYRNREFTYDKVTNVIEKTIQNNKGNYLIFFPSYRYMEEVYYRFIAKNEGLDIKVIIQKSNMLENERENFLKEFEIEREDTLVAFAVMGGIFGEGIDLVGDKLSGAIIVGVGLPQICFERNIIRDYFDEKLNLGFEYAYVYPGMNKVMQAVGRVIRTDADKGVVVLIDERFGHENYRKLFPEEWSHAVYVKNLKDIERRVSKFWK